MRPLLAYLAAGVAAGAVMPCVAQTNPGDPAINAVAASTAPAEAAPSVASAADTAVNEIVVLGFGQSRQVQSVTAADIARLTPGSSPLKAIEKLPGVNFQSADPFGAYEWAVRISLRGFSQNQLGFTLDGVPLGDMSYGNVNGLHISRASISENIGRTEVAQGAGALGTASTSNLGGTIQFFSRTPADTFGGEVSGTYGADNTGRAYVRLDTGEIGDGFKGYVSYAYLHTDKWKGYGEQYQHQVNAKLVKDLGGNGSVSAFFNFSDRREQDYQDLTLDLINRLGYRVDNIANNYPLALQIARAYNNGTALPAPYQTVDDVYYDAGGLRQDYLGGIAAGYNITPELTVQATGYYHHNRGQGSWITPYRVTPAGAPNEDGSAITNPAPLSFRTTEYQINRGGAIGTATYKTGLNTLEIGAWYENNHFDQARRYYGMEDGTEPNRATLDFQDHPFLTDWDGQYVTHTLQYHVEDTLLLFQDALSLSAGWKGVRVTNRASLTPGTRLTLAAGSISARDWFQPQVSALYHVTSNVELFADYAENLRAFVSSATTGPFSTTQAGFDAIRGTLKPERSKTVEGGGRFRAGPLQLSGAGYFIDFSNRLLSFSNGAGIAGNPATLNNVGSVHAYGTELSANYRVTQAFSFFGSYSYNHSKYQDDVTLANGAVAVATAGKTVTDSPKHMLKGELVYDDGQIFGRAGADYMSKRYFTYLNDESVPGRVLVDASVGYRFKRGNGFLNGVTVEANVTNLTDKRYIGTIGSNGYYASGDFDQNTLLAGAPRQWFVTMKKTF